MKTSSVFKSSLLATMVSTEGDGLLVGGGRGGGGGGDFFFLAAARPCSAGIHMSRRIGGHGDVRVRQQRLT